MTGSHRAADEGSISCAPQPAAGEEDSSSRPAAADEGSGPSALRVVSCRVAAAVEEISTPHVHHLTVRLKEASPENCASSEDCNQLN